MVSMYSKQRKTWNGPDEFRIGVTVQEDASGMPLSFRDWDTTPRDISRFEAVWVEPGRSCERIVPWRTFYRVACEDGEVVTLVKQFFNNAWYRVMAKE